MKPLMKSGLLSTLLSLHKGKHGKPEHIINLHNIPIVDTDRGGQVTFHGQGQAIIYFLLDVKRKTVLKAS